MRLSTWEAAPTSPASATTTVKAGSRTRRSLRVTCRPCRSTNLGPPIDHNAAARFRIEQRLRLGLRFFEFQFLGVFLTLHHTFRRRRTRLRQRCHMDLIYRFADFRKLARCRLRTLLAGSSRLLFKLVIAFIRRLFVADGIRFFFVDGLLFQRPWACESRNLFLRRSHSPIRSLGGRYHLIVFLDNVSNRLSS